MESVLLVNYFDLIRCRACAQQKEMEGSRDMIINMNHCFGCTTYVWVSMLRFSIPIFFLFCCLFH